MKHTRPQNFDVRFMIALAGVLLCRSLVVAETPDTVGIFASTWSGSGNATRNAAEVKRRGGWPGWIETHIEPSVAWATADAPGREVIVAIWNPFGTTPPSTMQPDQYAEAVEAGLDWLTVGESPELGFVPAWSAFKERQPNVRLLLYIGKWSADPTTRNLIAAGRLGEARERFDFSMRPIVAVADIVGLDALSASPAGGIDELAVDWIRDQGIEVVGELNPGVGEWQTLIPSTMLYKNMVRMHSPDRKPEDWLENVPTWDEAAFPLYADVGRWMIANTHSGKYNDPSDMRRMVRGSVEHGFGVLVQTSPKVLDQPIGWYFEADKPGDH